MNVLFVCRAKADGLPAPFNMEQAASLRRRGLNVEFFLIKNGRPSGYGAAAVELRSALRRGSFDVVHAHYGLAGFIANMQRGTPVVTTFHGSDVATLQIRPFSTVAAFLSAHTIVVEQRMAKALRLTKDFSVIPSGVDMDQFQPMDKRECREQLGLPFDEGVILFSGRFDTPVKNAELAMRACSLIPRTRLVELRGYDRSGVARMMNAADVLLLTSDREGSPQVVKEALACNLPVVSVPVGDVPDLIGGLHECHLVSRDPTEIASGLQQVLSSKTRGDSRSKIAHLSLNAVAARVEGVYRGVLDE